MKKKLLFTKWANTYYEILSTDTGAGLTISSCCSHHQHWHFSRSRPRWGNPFVLHWLNVLHVKFHVILVSAAFFSSHWRTGNV